MLAMGALATVRAAELRTVSEFLEHADAGPAALVFEGEPGIGKTTLWSDTVRLAAESGFRVLSARASATEARLTFAVLADLLDDVDATLLDQLAPVQRVALNRVLLHGDEGPATDERVAAAAFLSVFELLATQSRLLVAIDDLQWLDSPSRAVVSFAVRRLKAPVRIVATTRTGDPDSPSGSWLQLADHERLTRLSLRPLSLGGLHAVIRTRLGRTLPRPVITQIHKISGGNPLYALELARNLDDDLPPGRLGMPDSLNGLVRQRLGAVSEETSQLLLAAACMANPTVPKLAQAMHSSVERIVGLLEDVETQSIITLDGNRVRFTHPLLSHGVYTQASAPQRRAMHRKLAALTELPELRARHLALASVSADEATLQAIDVAADAAAARGTPSAAAELIDLAIRLGGDNPFRRLRAAEQHFRAGSLDEADNLLQSIIDTLKPGTLRAFALMLRSAVDGYGDRFGRAIDLLTQAVAEAGDNPALRVQGLLLLAMAIGVNGDLPASVDYARRAVAEAEELGNATLRGHALAVWVHISFIYGLDTDERALQTALTLEDPNSTAPANWQPSAVAAVNCCWTGNLHEGRIKLAALSQHCLERGQEVDVVWTNKFVTLVDLWLGRYSDAARSADAAMQRSEQIGGHLNLIEALTAQAAVSAHCGREDDSRRAARAAIDAARDNDINFLTIEPTASLAFLEVSLGNYEAAVATLEPLLAAFDPVHGTEIMVGGFLPDAIEALVAIGRLDEAELLVSALEANGARVDRPWMLAVGARGRAMILAARGDLDAAAAAAGQAIKHHDRLPMPFEWARTQLLVGQLQRRSRRKQAAAQALGEALNTFAAIGAPLWAARARAEVGRLHVAATDGTGLTASERRVAERAAAGLSNRDIAAELFLSQKTVEMNLSRVYRKLGIRSRAQLHARLNAVETRENPGSPRAITG
jgi:DNA-binding CsgD family transcriptional regulator